MIRLEDVHWDNQTLRELPTEEEEDGASPRIRSVRGAVFTTGLHPAPLNAPKLVAASEEVLQLLGLDPSEAGRPDFAEFFGGNQLLPGWQPAAHCYCGHQFGYFSGQLGDGAAMYMGEAVHPDGSRWEVQFKGSGLTPYSRQADGRKVLRSSLREFLCSEAMAALGIPTTRALCIVTSDSRVVRDPFYDGKAIQERASVVTRVAPTFLRFGSFEIFKQSDPFTGRAGPSAGLEPDMLPKMVDFTIKTYYPDIWASHGADGDLTADQKQTMISEWFREVCRRTGRMVALWMCVGWVHGVLNTDNMSILGLTLDYGPFGFMDRYDPDHISNGSDDAGRYDFKGQKSICRWNLERLSEALAPLVPGTRLLREINFYDQAYESTYWDTMRRKLGLLLLEEEADQELVNSLLQLMADTGADWTNSWRRLAKVPMPAASAAVEVDAAAADAAAAQALGGDLQVAAAATTTGEQPPGDQHDFSAFLTEHLPELASAEEMAEATAPRIPPANLQMLATVALRDPALLHTIGATPELIKRELERMKISEVWEKTSAAGKQEADRSKWTAWLTAYSRRLQKEADAGATAEARQQAMLSSNPRVVLRNWVAEEAIKAAEKGDYAAVRAILRDLMNPFAEPSADAAPSGAAVAAGAACTLRFDGPVPDWAKGLCVTCSS